MSNESLELGVIGGNLVKQAAEKNIDVVGMAPSEHEEIQEKGIPVYDTDEYEAFLSNLSTPRIVYISVPAGDIVDKTLDQLADHAEESEETVERTKTAPEEAGVSLPEAEIDDRIDVIPSPTRIESSVEDVLMEMRRRGGEEAAERVESGMPRSRYGIDDGVGDRGGRLEARRRRHRERSRRRHLPPISRARDRRPVRTLSSSSTVRCSWPMRAIRSRVASVGSFVAPTVYSRADRTKRLPYRDTRN